MVAMLEWLQMSHVAETVGAAAFRAVLGGLSRRQSRVMLTVLCLDVGELRHANRILLSIDTAIQHGMDEACST